MEHTTSFWCHADAPTDLRYSCVLPAGHTGFHVACGIFDVKCVWDEDGELSDPELIRRVARLRD